MPVLPIMDLLILIGWGSFFMGGLLKVIYSTTAYRPEIMSMGPMEFLTVAVSMMIFALALAARTWVKSNEPGILASQRAADTLSAYAAAQAENGGTVETEEGLTATPRTAEHV